MTMAYNFIIKKCELANRNNIKLFNIVCSKVFWELEIFARAFRKFAGSLDKDNFVYIFLKLYKKR